MTEAASSRRGARAEKEPAPAGSTGFQHQKYLEYRDGMPYLPLKWLLAWLRSDYPQARISTKLVSHQQGTAIFKALIELPEGGAATGWGAQSHPESRPGHAPNDGHLDYIAAAENRALVRALAALGYGTEYVQDFDQPAEHEPIPLPLRPTYEAEEVEGIEVPLVLAAAPAPIGESLPDDDSDDEDEAGQADIPAPAPLRPASPRGEVRAMYDKRPAAAEAPARVAERPAPLPAETPPVPAAPANLNNQAVEDRLKNVRDEALRLTIKQIYHEARARFNIDEDRVDARSRSRFGKPANELDSEEAEQFLEVILNAVKRRT